MLYTHTIGRIGKDCQVITGIHGTFMAVDIAVDDYSRGQNITTWVRVRSSRENHVRLAEYLTKGRLILVEGTISTSQWKDRQGESHTQISINADSIAFVNAGRKRSRTPTRRRLPRKELRQRTPLSPHRTLQNQTRRTYHSKGREEDAMRYARLFVPYRGYWDIQVDLNSIEGGYHGYQYNCIVVGSGAEITCYRDEFEFVD